MAPRRNALPAPGGLFESTGNRARQAGAGNPGVSGFNDRGVTDFSAGINALNAAVQDIQLQRDSVKAVGLETEATVQMQAEMAKLNPLDKDYQTQVKAVTDAAKQRVLDGGLTNTAVLDDISKRMDRHGAAMQIAAIGETKSAINKQAQLTYRDALDAQNAKIRNDPANANLYVDEFKADAERLKVGMDPVAFEAVSRGAADEFAKNQVIGYAEKGNFGAAKNALKAQASHLKTEVVTGLSNYIDTKESKARADGDRAQTAAANGLQARMYDWAHGLGPPVPREDIDKFKGTANYAAMVNTFGAATEKLAGKSAAEQEKVIAQKATDISARISDANAGKGPMPSREEIEALKNYRQYDDLVKQHNAVEIHVKKEAEKTATASDQFLTGTLSSQENADRAFINQYGNIPFGQIAMNGTPEQKAAGILLATTMAAGSGGYLPSQMKNLISNADGITNPKQAAAVSYAAEAMDEIEAKAPGKLAGVTLSDTGVVNRTRAEAKRLIADGVPKQEAYTMAAQSQMPKDKMTLQQETDNLAKADDLLKKINPSQQALGAVTTFAQRNIPFVATPEVTATMSAEWTRVFKDGMKATNGDEVRAKALADKKIADTFGQTLVGVTDARQFTPSASPGATTAGPYAATYAGAGSTSEGMVGQGKVTVQKHPPEKYMPFPNLSNEQKAKVIMAELDTFNKKHGIAPSPDKDLPGAPVVQLFADAQTEADIRAGRPPSYQYKLLRGTIYEPAIDTKTGAVVRYRVPSNPDQLKDNPAYQAAEKTRIDDFNKKQALDIELKTAVPDAPADERLKRMREEGRKLKGNR